MSLTSAALDDFIDWQWQINFFMFGIYSSTALSKLLVDKFENEHDIKVNIISAKANQLINKIIQEGEYTKADILLTTDVGRLHYGKEKGIFQKVTSPTIQNNLPSNFKDKDNYWFGISIRSRLLVFNKKNVNEVDCGYLKRADNNNNNLHLMTFNDDD